MQMTLLTGLRVMIIIIIISSSSSIIISQLWDIPFLFKISILTSPNTENILYTYTVYLLTLL